MIYMPGMFGVVLIVVLCAAGCSNKESEKTKVPRQHISAVADKTTLLATIAADEKPLSITPSSGLGMHATLPASFQFIFSERGGGVAYIVEKNGKSHVVHNGSAGKPYSTVGTVALSPDGKRIAYGALAEGKWRMVIDGKEGAGFNTVKSPLFSPDGQHVAYQAMVGEKWHLVVDATPDAGTHTRILDHYFSGDSAKIAYIDNANDMNRGRLVVSDLAFKNPRSIESNVSLVVLNADKTRIAAISISDNNQRVIEFSFDSPDTLKKGSPYAAVYNLTFGTDSDSVAYVSAKGPTRLQVLNGSEESFPPGALVEPLVVRPDQNGIGIIMASDTAAFLYQSQDAEKKENEYDEATSLVYSRDGSYHAYAARKGKSWFVVVNGTEGPVFDRVVTPKFSPDGKYLVYRARKAGMRFVVVADVTGTIIRMHPAYEQVFDVLFTADGKSVAYGVKDGQKLIWKVEAL